MGTFVCRIGTEDGMVTTRSIDAPDEASVRTEISRQGAKLFSIKASAGSKRAVAGAPVGTLRFGARKQRAIKMQEFLIFNQELVALMKAGLPIVAGFDILLERQENPYLKRILTDVKKQLVSGVALSDAFLSHGAAFPRLYATSLKAGERSGEVEKVLRRFLVYQKILGTVRRRVVAALVYPSLLITLSVGLIVIMMTYVIPKFTEFYAGFDAQLPILTRVVIGTANTMRAHALVGVVIVVALAIAFPRWRRTDRGQRLWDSFLLKIPLVGTILHQFALSQFARSLATLVGEARRSFPRSRSRPAPSRIGRSPMRWAASFPRSARGPSSGGASRTRISSRRSRSR